MIQEAILTIFPTLSPSSGRRPCRTISVNSFAGVSSFGCSTDEAVRPSCGVC